jgi:hypothetical protein
MAKSDEVSDTLFKVAESILNLSDTQAVRIKLNSAKFSLFRTCYLAPQVIAPKLFANAILIPDLDWVSLQAFYSGSFPKTGVTGSHLDSLPKDTRKEYEAKAKKLFTVVPFYTIKHNITEEEAKTPPSPDKMTFNTELHPHFASHRMLRSTGSYCTTSILNMIFEKMDAAKLVLNGTTHETVCRFCENYFRKVAGMCNFKKSHKDGTLEKKDPARALCALKLLYNSELDDVPEAQEALYQGNLLQELSLSGTEEA